MRLSDFNIVYISLDKRPEKRKYIEDQLSKMGLLENATYFPGIDGESLPKKIQDYYLSRFKTMAKKRDRIIGRIGCYLSHKCILHAAMVSNLDNILILEDDCNFISKKPNIIIPSPPQDAEMFYLGGLFWNQNPEPLSRLRENEGQPWILIDRNYVKLACALAYGIIGKQNIRSVYNKINNVRPSAIDLLYINYVQFNKQHKDPTLRDKKPTCYILNPVICIQEHKFESDVTFKGTKNPQKPYKNSYFYTKKQENNYYNKLKKIV